jgi:4-aminobutyrate aminotransferase-like enzyme
MQWSGSADSTHGDLSALQKKFRDAGVLVHRAGADVLRLLPPLTFSRQDIADLLAAMETTLV